MLNARIFNIFLFAVFTTFAALAPALAAARKGGAGTSLHDFAGTVALWTRPACTNDEEFCPLPAPLGITWSVNLQFEAPRENGEHVVVDQTLRHAPYRVRLLVVWVIGDGNEPPYIVTQTKLSHDTLGPIAECSRFDAVGAFTFLPPGACSGQAAGKMVGVSFMK